MGGTMLYGPGDERFEERDDPAIVHPNPTLSAILKRLKTNRLRDPIS